MAGKYFLLQYFPKVKVFDLAKAELRNNCQKILLLLLFFFNLECLLNSLTVFLKYQFAYVGFNLYQGGFVLFFKKAFLCNVLLKNVLCNFFRVFKKSN